MVKSSTDTTFFKTEPFRFNLIESTQRHDFLVLTFGKEIKNRFYAFQRFLFLKEISAS